MFFLTKMFKLRDKVNPDEEKPFLDHLEDLRIMVTRIAMTLIIATLVCFIYKDTLMEIIRAPVEQVWVDGHEATLPEGEEISLKDWEKALSFSQVSAPLGQYDPDLAERWWAQATDERTRRLTEAAIVYRAALKLDEEKQEDFLKSLPDSKSEARELALKLLISKPADNLNAEGNLRLMSSLKPTETFMLSMKLAFFAGIVVSFPFLLYFLLQFIVPGLKDEERKALWPALAIGFGLFLTGVLFAYFYVLPNVLTFFYEYGKGMGISNDWRIGYYISFATTFVLIFGLAFELPVVVMTLVKIGLLSHSMMRETRSYAILAIFVIAALITPTPDMLTLSLLAVPMVILYEICIWLSYFHEKKVAKMEAEEEEENMKRLLSEPDEHGDEDEEKSDLDLTEEGEEEDVTDDYMDFPGEHHSHEEDPNYDPYVPEDDKPEDPKDPKDPDEKKDDK
ncbi:MAG: sec-independent protein translocase protein TatC [Akkermansiaceae bacterium]|jgi:sec-independent protein translocase protein TatC